MEVHHGPFYERQKDPLAAIKNITLAYTPGSCDSSWTAGTAGDHKTKTCKVYAERNFCVNGTYGSGWNQTWGTFEDYADRRGRTVLVCPECGCRGIDEAKLDRNKLRIKCREGNLAYVKEQSKIFGIKAVVESESEYAKCLFWVATGHIGEELPLQNRLDLAQFLLENGADIEELYRIDPETPLIAAIGRNASQGDIPMMKFLIEAGADVNFREGWRAYKGWGKWQLGGSKFSRTPLFYTGDRWGYAPWLPKEEAWGYWNKKFATLSELVKHGAVIDAKDKDNSTCLRLAIIRNESDWALALAKHGASFETAYLAAKEDGKWMDRFDRYMNTTIMQKAIIKGQTLQGADIDHCQFNPWTHGCVHGNCIDEVDNYKCECDLGYTGTDCNEDINECNSGPCKNGGACTNSDGSYSCAENYITLTNDVGTAFATNEYSGAYNATKAFKMQDIGDDAYWATKRNPPTPVFLWFQFKDPQRVITIKFKEKYALPLGKEYEVFASNDFGNCGNQENQKIIFSGSENLFAAGAGFENQLYFYCYGLKISHKRYNWWFGLSQLQFEVEDGNECAANSHNCDLNAHCFITMGSLQCFCKAGYTGDGTTGNCADVNECDLSTHNCDLNADCSNSVGSFACSCRAGYTGDGTTGNCADINECNSGPCKN